MVPLDVIYHSIIMLYYIYSEVLCCMSVYLTAKCNQFAVKCCIMNLPYINLNLCMLGGLRYANCANNALTMTNDHYSGILEHLLLCTCIVIATAV